MAGKKQQLWEKRDGVIKDAAEACSLYDVSQDTVKVLQDVTECTLLN